MKDPIIIGIAGGSASGKTTLADRIIAEITSDIVLIRHDNYYKRQDHIPLADRPKVNYDHPSAFDTDLLIADLKRLCDGRSVEVPVYSYIEHNRTDQAVPVRPARVIIVEGILVLENPQMSEMMDIKVFVDADADLRLIRKIKRDVIERKRTLESVIAQYENFSKPMHEQFIEPTKKKADIIIPNGGYNEVGIGMLIDKIRAIIAEKQRSLP
ncbi:MAG: uridine kinase [Brevinematales bacterium]|nr:uridine kinase [Brevinematales bacterium]